MAKRRPSGDGMVRKREDGRWEGRIVVGHKQNGEPIFGYVLFYPQLGVKLCSMAGGGVQKIYMVFLREPSRRGRSGSDLFHLRDGFEIKMNFDRNVSCFILVDCKMKLDT